VTQPGLSPASGTTQGHSGVRRRRRTRTHSRARWFFGLLFLAVVVLVVGGGAFLAWRYLPYLDQAREARASAQQLSATLHNLGLGLTQDDLDTVKTELDDVDAKLQPFRTLLADDSLVQLARNVPALRDQIDGGSAALAAADDLLSAAHSAVDIGQRYVDIRTGAQGSADASTLANLVQLMATSTGDVNTINGLLTSAQQHLDQVPADAMSQIRDAHDLMAEPLAQYAPLLRTFTSLESELPSILGWGGQRRYLVLAEDPAELRPMGGFAGTYGIITFKDGQLSQYEFHDIYTLDTPDTPYVQPPQGLEDHLLGSKWSWQLADSLWSPDFPTGAQEAVKLYTLESGGDSNIDGVFTLTTYAMDDLLKVIGPVDVPDYNTTVHSGEVTLKTLALTRTSTKPDVNRKQFLQALATAVLGKLFALSPAQWTPLLDQFQVIGQQRLANVWFADPGAEALVSSSTWGGEVRQDAGDYLYVVDSNAAPASKYNLIVTRSTDLHVQIDQYGNATSTLHLAWQNDSGKSGEPYASLRSYSTGDGGIYGDYVRVLTPDRSRLQSVSGGTRPKITGPETVTTEAGRTVFANYLAVPPGSARLSYSWISPYPVDLEDSIGTYTLTIQKQPGMTAEPISVTITVPDNARITDTSAGLTVTGTTATYTGTLTQDLQLAIRYRTT
jgi:Protein of unknown function (DUF4012)